MKVTVFREDRRFGRPLLERFVQTEIKYRDFTQIARYQVFHEGLLDKYEIKKSILTIIVMILVKTDFSCFLLPIDSFYDFILPIVFLPSLLSFHDSESNHHSKDAEQHKPIFILIPATHAHGKQKEFTQLFFHSGT